MTWCTYLQSFEKIHNVFLSYSAKTKRDGQTDGRTALQYFPSQAFGAAGDNNIQQENMYTTGCQIKICMCITYNTDLYLYNLWSL